MTGARGQVESRIYSGVWTMFCDGSLVIRLVGLKFNRVQIGVHLVRVFSLIVV